MNADAKRSAAATGPGVPPALLPLRKDIEMLAGGHADGSPHWIIYDPLQHRYFKIDNRTKEILGLWRAGMSEAELLQLASERRGDSIDPGQLTELVRFVRSNGLAENTEADAWRGLAQRAKIGRRSALGQLIHNYLFFKIPLFRPQRALETALPFVEVFYRRETLAVVAAFGLAGAYLVSRQWDAFIHTFLGFFTLEGMFWFVLMLAFTKTMHELGHAFTAARFGCRIPTMGVAFMVLVPMPYTDVTDAWRLKSRRQRLLIDGAGVMVELALACIATFLWAFLPDGALRGAVFMVATTGWVLSLGLNLNPFMRFDGYYLLSDLVGIENLQPRSFALGRWKLRQILFAPRLAPPESLSQRTRNWLIVYAWTTWLYRLVVFTGIALYVYHHSFKALGIILFLIEIWYFVLRPVLLELSAWRNIEYQEFSPRRSAVAAGAVLAVFFVLIFPWSTRIEVPAVLSAADLTQIYPVRPAKIVAVQGARGDDLPAGVPIVTLEAPQIDRELSATQIKIDLIKLRLGHAADDVNEREQYAVLTHQLAGLQTAYEGLLKEKDDLIVRAPIDGTILEIGDNLHVGRWLGKTDLIAIMSGRKKYIARGYIAEPELNRIGQATMGRFIPDDLTRQSIDVRLIGIASTGATHINIQELASVHGGRIAVVVDANQGLAPVTGQYLIELEPVNFSAVPNQRVRGVVELHGTNEAFVIKALRNVWQVLIRESGF